MLRREFFFSSIASALLKAAGQALRIAHRQASMQLPGPEVFELARRIPGLSGVELQVHYRNQTLWDAPTLAAYKAAAQKTDLRIPSLAGVWEKGVGITQTGPAEEALRKSIKTAEALGSSVVLVAAFGKNCPRMEEEASYGPVVTLLRKVAPMASDAGVILGLETSLSPEHDKKLVDLVDKPSVRIYFDAHNTARYGYGDQVVPGIRLLGKSRICQVHCKNGDQLLEAGGSVDWAAILDTYRDIGYSGWYVFETQHSSSEQCVTATQKNIDFIRRHS